MAVPGVDNGDTRKTVQVLLPLGILESRPSAFNKDDVVPGVNAGHNVLFV